MDSQTVDVVVNPLPTCNISGPTTFVPNAQDVMYSGPAGMASYSWSILSGDATIDGASGNQGVAIDFGSNTTTIQLIITDVNGCENTCTVTLGLDFYDLALTKEIVSAGPFAPGDTVTFRIYVTNQGLQDAGAGAVTVTDYVPASMTNVDTDLTANMFTFANAIPAGAVDSVDKDLRIDPGFMGTSITNNAEITADDGDDIDSAPGDNAGDAPDLGNDDSTVDGNGDGTIQDAEDDDFDPAVINLTQVFDLALTKQINATATPPPYAPGSTVQFTIEVFNQGTLDAYDIDVADYVPTGLGAVTLVGGQTGVSANGLNGYTVDFVGAGLSTTFEVEATIAMNFQGNSLVNNAEITGGSDVDGGADATDADSCLLYTSPSPRDQRGSRMPSSA